VSITDVLNEQEKEVIAQIANTNDHPVLMMNFNRYKPGAYPDSSVYREWRKINAEMIGNVGGKIVFITCFGTNTGQRPS